MEQVQKSYLQQRVYGQMRVTPDQNKIKIITEDRHGGDIDVEMPIFSSDKDDNIDILVYTIERRLIKYDHPNANPTTQNINNNREQTFKLTRLKNPQGDKKYNIPKGVGTYPFFPPSVIDKYEKGEKIKTLILTEGYFKAFMASVNGWDIVGLSSITHYADKKTKQIHFDIQKIILKCEVENVVMLYDGDCLNISTTALEKGEDIAKRPNAFFSSILKINELLTDYDVKVYFAHVLSDNIENNPKGLDDLLIELQGKENEILDDMLMLGKQGFYFYRINLLQNIKKLKTYFNLANAEQFYGAWEDIIKEREFVYFGTKYKVNEKGKLENILPKEAQNYMRVGNYYYEMVPVPTIFGETETKLYQRNKEVIKEDLGKNILSKIAKYKAFTNIPSHTNYQQIINNCYNMYAELPHVPDAGNCDTILSFLNHIFQHQIELGLDYIQLLYQQPTQVLPILCLVSKENETGKTTFLDLLKEIFGENAVKVGNAELNNDFNAYIATRLVVGVDETFMEKASTIEKIKMLSTSNRIAMQRKGLDHEEMWHFAKYILVSNREENFIYASKDDVRYWVIKVPKIERKNQNPDMLKIMYDEIPAFLYFLNERKISVPKKSRAWFDPSLLETEALKKLRSASKSTAEKEIDLYIRNIFLEFGVEEFTMTLETIKENTVKNRYENSYLNKLLKENMNVEKSEKTARPSHPFWVSDVDDNFKFEWTKGNPARPYIFKRKNFLTDQEIEQIKSVFTERKPEKEVQEKLPF